MIYELLAALESMTEEELNDNYPQVREPLENAVADFYINWFKNEKHIVLLDHIRWAGLTPLHKQPLLTLIELIKTNKDLLKPSLVSVIYSSLEVQLKSALTEKQINKLIEQRASFNDF